MHLFICSMCSVLDFLCFIPELTMVSFKFYTSNKSTYNSASSHFLQTDSGLWNISRLSLRLHSCQGLSFPQSFLGQDSFMMMLKEGSAALLLVALLYSSFAIPVKGKCCNAVWYLLCVLSTCNVQC